MCMSLQRSSCRRRIRPRGMSRGGWAGGSDLRRRVPFFFYSFLQHIYYYDTSNMLAVSNPSTWILLATNSSPRLGPSNGNSYGTRHRCHALRRVEVLIYPGPVNRRHLCCCSGSPMCSEFVGLSGANQLIMRVSWTLPASPRAQNASKRQRYHPSRPND
jgi:hypothetical protein